MTEDYRANVIPPEKIPVTVNISIQLYQVISVNEPDQVYVFNTSFKGFWRLYAKSFKLQYIEISFAPCMTWMDTRIDVNLSNANDDMKDGSQTPYINLPSSTEDSTIWIPDICKVTAYNV